MTTAIRFALPVALLLAAATSARAASEEPTAPVAPAASSSYGWQVAAANAAAVGIGAAGFSLEGKDGSLNYIPSNTMMGVGIGGYFLGGTVVHAAHGRWGRAALSLMLKAALPMTGMVIGAGFASCTPNEWLCGLEEMGKGMMVGAVAAAVVDTVLIAPWSSPSPDKDPERIEPVASRRRAGASFAPTLAATPNAAMLGLGGRF